MKVSLQMVLVLFVGLAVASGCKEPEDSKEGGNGHSHGDDDALIWQRADLEHEGYLISLGHHGEHLHAGDDVEPAVMITKEESPVADAMVFVTLLNAAGENVITEEQATTYEPPTDAEPAHYAQAIVKVPADATEVMLRYRIRFSEGGEFSQDVVIQTGTHE